MDEQPLKIIAQLLPTKENIERLLLDRVNVLNNTEMPHYIRVAF
jgi:hypothetical protein